MKQLFDCSIKESNCGKLDSKSLKKLVRKANFKCTEEEVQEYID